MENKIIPLLILSLFIIPTVFAGVDISFNQENATEVQKLNTQSFVFVNYSFPQGILNKSATTWKMLYMHENITGTPIPACTTPPVAKNFTLPLECYNDPDKLILKFRFRVANALRELIMECNNGTDFVTVVNVNECTTCDDSSQGSGSENVNDTVDGNEATRSAFLNSFGRWGRAICSGSIREGIHEESMNWALNSGEFPFFTTILANATTDHLGTIGVDFDADVLNVTGEVIDTFTVDDPNFVINSSGFLTNIASLPVGTITVNITVNESVVGNTNSTLYGITVSKSNSTCTITSNGLLFFFGRDQTNVSGSCDNTDISSNLFRNGLNVNSENGLLVDLAIGTFNYLVNVSETANFTSGSASLAPLIVRLRTGVEGACDDSDTAWQDAVGIAGLLFTIVLVGIVITTLTLLLTGVIDPGRLAGEFTLESAPGIIMVIGITFLVIATMSFLIASSVCVAFGA